MSDLGQNERRRLPDRCQSCGRFVGQYPQDFYCDTHCARCICTRCPGFRQPPVLARSGESSRTPVWGRIV